MRVYMQDEVKKDNQYQEIWKKIEWLGRKENIPLDNITINNYGEYQIVTICYLSPSVKKKEKYLIIDKNGNIIYSQGFIEDRILPLDEHHFVYTSHEKNQKYHQIVFVQEGNVSEKYGWRGIEPLEDSIHRNQEYPEHIIISHQKGQTFYNLKKGLVFDQNCFITYDKGEFHMMENTETFRCIKHMESDILLEDGEERESCTLQFFIDFDGNTISDLYDLDRVERYHTENFIPLDLFFGTVIDSLNEKQLSKRNKKILRKAWLFNIKNNIN